MIPLLRRPGAAATIRPPMRLPLLVAALLVAGLGCGRKIGDSCKANADCSALGDRFCDISVRPIYDRNGQEIQGGGYCTVEGCDVRLDTNDEPVDSCPGEAVCVRFFRTTGGSCNPAPGPEACPSGERCVCSCPSPQGGCQPSYLLSSVDGGVGCDAKGGGARPRGDGGAEVVGRCAAESSERRWCMRRCDSDGDCREPRCSQSGQRPCFECRSFGDGAEAVAVPSWARNVKPLPRFCVQRGGS